MHDSIDLQQNLQRFLNVPTLESFHKTSHRPAIPIVRHARAVLDVGAWVRKDVLPSCVRVESVCRNSDIGMSEFL